MVQIPATFDGAMFHPHEPVTIPADTEVLLTVEPVASDRPSAEPTSFIETVLSLRTTGPSDWSSRVDHYLYGNLVDEED